MREHLENQVIDFLDDLTDPDMYGFAVSREVVKAAAKLMREIVEEKEADIVEKDLTAPPPEQWEEPYGITVDLEPDLEQWEEYIAEEARVSEKHDMTERQSALAHVWLEVYLYWVKYRFVSGAFAASEANDAVSYLNEELGE